MGIFSKFKNALKKTREGLSNALSGLFSRNKIGNDFYDGLEEILIGADISVTTAEEIVDEIRAEAKHDKIKDKEREDALDANTFSIGRLSPFRAHKGKY